MELEYSDKNSKRSKLYIGVGLVIALIVGGIVFVALQATGLTAQAKVETREVVVAVREIPGRKPIEEGDVAMRTVTADVTNATAFNRIDEVLGRVSGLPISTGQLVTRNFLASTTQGQAFSILEPGQDYDPAGPNLRAVSVSVPDERAVAGTLQAGQRVDLLVTMAINPEIGQDAGQAAVPRASSSGALHQVSLQKLDILARNGALSSCAPTSRRPKGRRAHRRGWPVHHGPAGRSRRSGGDDHRLDDPPSDRRVRLPGAAAAGLRQEAGGSLGAPSARRARW